MLLQRLINHPVHIMNDRGELSSSSFIPFCSFGDKLIGADLDGFNLPVCNIFKPKHFIDKICYETSLQNLKDNNDIGKIMQQLELGLILVLDYNEERQMNVDSISSKEFSLMNEGNYGDGNFVSMHLDTICTYTKKYFINIHLYLKHCRSRKLVWRRTIQPQ